MSAAFAISVDFLSSLYKLPIAAQRQVNAFIVKWKRDPRSTGINLEAIKGSRDLSLRSVRINDSYRGIVAKPQGADTVVLLYVDRHDPAYEWACRRRCEINPETGALQIVDVQTVETAAASTSQAPSKSPGLFAEIRDRHLLKLGVPASALPAVRAIKSDDDLDTLESVLPDDANEALFMLAAGYSLDETFAHQEKSASLDQAAKVDPKDFEAALERPESQQRFWVVDDDGALQAMLEAPLEKWRVFLHPSQRRLVDRHWNGPVRVLGGAGTGKTVVAMHRAKWLAERLTEPGNRILFTTFTRNLAADIEANLRQICTPEVMGRTRVSSIDALVSEYLRQKGYAFEIVFDDDPRVDEAWKDALTEKEDTLGLSDRFFRDEWREVVQAQGLASEEEYLRAPRSGRGQVLNRSKRKAVWSVFAAYRANLIAGGLKEGVDAMHDMRVLLENCGAEGVYQHIVVDEAQDMGSEAFRLLRRLAGPQRADDIFLVGDAHQRIYGRRTSLGASGIDIRGRGKKLRLNYRTTDEVRRFACSVLIGVSVDDLDDGVDDLRGYRSLLHGERPIVLACKNSSEQTDAIVDRVASVRASGGKDQGICLIVTTNRDVDAWQQILKTKEIPTRKIERRRADDPSKEGVRIATMHRVKGLQFEHVIIPDLDARRFPDPNILSKMTDDVERRRYIDQCKRLLFVALTRARRTATLSWVGECSSLIPSKVAVMH